MDAPAPRCFISVAIPVYNEIEALPDLHRRLERVLSELTESWEIVIADDGSAAETRDYLRELAARDTRVRVVLLSRNFGHTPAYMAALEHCSGEWTVVMDGDLQDEPEVIPRMLAAAQEGADVVYAIKAKRPEGILMRSAFSLYYRLAKRFSKVEQPAHAGPFSLISHRAVGEILELRERNLFFPGVRSYVGHRQVGIQVERPDRSGGRSRIPLRRRITGALDGIFAFSDAPLRIATWMGFTIAAIAAVLAIAATVLRLVSSIYVSGITTVITIVLFLGGVQLITLGIIGEYLGRIYGEVKQRPRYVIEERLNFEAGDAPAVPREVAAGPPAERAR
jgi:polyisoprenyl-phosphate glycosyltransferase